MMNEFHYSERQACKLPAMDRSSNRYRPRMDHNVDLHRELITLARQKPRYGYRRLCALLERRGCRASPQRVYRVYSQEHLAVRRSTDYMGIFAPALTRWPTSLKILCV